VKFLITNDDGIAAEGLQTLCSVAAQCGEAVVVAPDGPQSGVSHRVTWQKGVRIEQRGPDRFAVHGTPADCVRLGLLHCAPDAKWILSGINHGSNLGADMHYSGTVAAVREGVLHGWPGIAFSQYHKAEMEFHWPRAAKWIGPILQELLARPVEPGCFYNVNLPDLPPDAPDPEIVWCALDPKPLPLNYRHEEESGLYYAGEYRLRPQTPGADVDVCFSGRIAITAVRLL
jgi:5'-nucleotidase